MGKIIKAKKELGCVVQVQDHEFKTQYHQKKKVKAAEGRQVSWFTILVECSLEAKD
jgi:hypothetical protein